MPPNEIIELYYFFVGILFSTLTCLILAFLKFKASIHMMAVSGVFMFFIALSIHFSININGTLPNVNNRWSYCNIKAAFKSSYYNEIIVGLFIGLIPQLIFLNYWL